MILLLIYESDCWNCWLHFYRLGGSACVVITTIMQASNTKATSDQVLVTFFLTFNDGTELLLIQPLKDALQVDTNCHKLHTSSICVTGWYW